jgi:hypothetical protein
MQFKAENIGDHKKVCKKSLNLRKRWLKCEKWLKDTNYRHINKRFSFSPLLPLLPTLIASIHTLNDLFNQV